MSHVKDVACETYLNLVFCIMFFIKSSNTLAKSGVFFGIIPQNVHFHHLIDF